MTLPKPEIVVDLDTGSATPVTADAYLSCLKSGVSYHEHLDSRHPLGIYNVSTSRILKKLTKCCSRLEDYQREAPTVSSLQNSIYRKEEVIDYIELCLYAAAEHVDDVEAVARCFFKDNR